MQGRSLIEEFASREGLDSIFRSNCENYFLSLAENLLPLIGTTIPLVVGINGSQGSGKSTLGKFLSFIFQELHQLNAVTVSLDDFYLEREHRLLLARDIHPLFETRGPPATHDLDLAIRFFENINGLTKGQKLKIPAFNKAIDDRAPESHWAEIEGPIDILIFEGWCISATPQVDLSEPINELERIEDSKSIWRKHVNDSLHSYQKLWDKLNYLVFLKAPSMEAVVDWRKLQEKKTSTNFCRKRYNDGKGN